MIEAMKQAVVYFEHMVRTLKLRDQSEPAQLLFKLRQAIEQAEKQEPFGYFQYAMHFDAWVQNRDSNTRVAFYTTPPAAQRDWVGLTDEEFDLLVPYCGNEFDLKDYKDFARDIEAKLKEKNT